MRVRCQILKSSSGGDPLGISKDHDVVLLTDETDPPETVNGIPVVKLIKRDLGGEYLSAEPVKKIEKGHVGYMMGGTYIMGSSSMGFPARYPIPLHDRVESIELYKMMD